MISLINTVRGFLHLAPIDQRVASTFTRLTPIQKAVSFIALSLFALMATALTYAKKLKGRVSKDVPKKLPDLKPFSPSASNSIPIQPPAPSQQSSSQPLSAAGRSAVNETPNGMTQSGMTGNVERQFWELYFGEKELHKFLQMVVINRGEDPKNYPACAALLIEGYENFIRSQTSSFSLDKEVKDHLAKIILFQLEQNGHSTPSSPVNAPVKPENSPALIHKDAALKCEKALGDGRLLFVYKTVADGSCGLHALLGKECNQHGDYQCDAVDSRKSFCDKLEQLRRHDQLPIQIKTTLYDYFLRFDVAPSSFRDVTRDLYSKLREGYGQLSKKDQDERKETFMNSPLVFDAYLANLRKVGTYLLQDELIAAARVFNKKLILCQPDWLNSEIAVAGESTIANSDAEKVYIWYNGINHYEKAFVLE